MSTWEPAPVEKPMPWWKIVGLGIFWSWVALTLLGIVLTIGLPLLILAAVAYVTRR